MLPDAVPGLAYLIRLWLLFCRSPATLLDMVVIVLIDSGCGGVPGLMTSVSRVGFGRVEWFAGAVPSGRDVKTLGREAWQY